LEGTITGKDINVDVALLLEAAAPCEISVRGKRDLSGDRNNRRKDLEQGNSRPPRADRKHALRGGGKIGEKKTLRSESSWKRAE